MSLMDTFVAWKQRKEYESNLERSKASSLYLFLNADSFNKSAERVKHPFHDARLASYKEEVSKWTKKKVNVNFGDSLTDLSRKQIIECHDGIFSISGSWANHIEQMAVDMKPALVNFDVANISVGCLGGNPMLCFQYYDEVLKDSLKALNSIRGLYPNSRIIVYGLPPVYSIYVSQNTYQFDLELRNWTIQDKNARFISLKETFGTGFGKLFPSTEWSSDGVHFNPNGGAKFASLIKEQQG